MASARQKSEWDQTAWMMHMANVAAGYPFMTMKTANDWNPFSSKHQSKKGGDGSLAGMRRYFV